MSADIPSTPPTEVRAGDTIKWRRELSDYPASDSWQLKFTLVGSAGVYSGDAAADGDDHLVTIPAATSTTYTAGLYTLTEYVTNGSERYTIGTRDLRILADLAGATAATDTRSHARKMVDAIEAWLESRAPVAGSLEIAGRKIQHYPIADLLKLRDRYKLEAQRESAAASGGRTGRLLVRI